MGRPEHLPDFAEPPLEEVVLGVQFAPIPQFTPVSSARIWELFNSEFPNVREQKLLAPQFETFGGVQFSSGPKIQVSGPPIGSRLWFVSTDENHLLQFQPDLFIVNWRKSPNPKPYPRFEGIADAFRNNLLRLADHLSTEFSYSIDVNQAEVTYINIIPVEDFSHAGRWFNILDAGSMSVEALSANFNEVIHDRSGSPYARLKHEISSVFSIDGKQKALRLSLSFRGKPEKNDIESAVEFHLYGRDVIVNRFAEITTEQAHKTWKRRG